MQRLLQEPPVFAAVRCELRRFAHCKRCFGGLGRGNPATKQGVAHAKIAGRLRDGGLA